MATKSETEYRRTAVRCPEHGSTHIQRLIMPAAGEYFAAYYTPACCAAYELDRRSAKAAESVEFPGNAEDQTMGERRREDALCRYDVER